jgi:hypothetical protein
VRGELEIKKSTGKSVFQVFVVVMCISCVCSIIMFAVGDAEILNEPIIRVELCAGFVIVAYWYYRASETELKMWIGLGKIAVALGSDWYQIGKWAQEGWHIKSLDRWAWIAAGLAVLQSGIKDVAEGNKIRVEKSRRRTGASTPKPNA